MSKSKLEGVNEGRLQVAEGEVEGRGAAFYFGTKVDIGKGTIHSKLDAMVSKGTEGSDEVVRVVVKLGVVGNGA